MEATLQKVQQELKSDEWELRVDGLKALTKLGEETRTPDERQQLAKLLKQEGIGKLVTDQLRNLRSCLLYTSPSPRDATLSRMPSSA